MQCMLSYMKGSVADSFFDAQHCGKYNALATSLSHSQGLRRVTSGLKSNPGLPGSDLRKRVNLHNFCLPKYLNLPAHTAALCCLLSFSCTSTLKAAHLQFWPQETGTSGTL